MNELAKTASPERRNDATQMDPNCLNLVSLSEKTEPSLVDKFISGPTPHEGNLFALGLLGGVSGFAVGLPWMFSTGMPGPAKGFFAAEAVVIIDRALDMAVGDTIGGHRFFRPNGLETLAIGMAVSLPVNDLKIKAAAAATGWLAGRVYNYFQH